MAPDPGEEASGTASETARELARMISRMGEHLRRHFHEVVAAEGLNPPQAALLRDLDHPRPMGAIADHMCVDASYVTALVDRLEELGYVERRPDPSDRRVKQVAITPNGRKVRESIGAAFVASALSFDRLDEEEQETLLSLLEKALSDP